MSSKVKGQAPMAKSTNGNGHRAGAVHLMLQGKGGVGKSTCSAFLAQYLLEKGHNVHGIDSDMSNHTFREYEALPIEEVSLVVDGVIDVKGFDRIYDSILGDARTFVVDSGANSFVPLWNHMQEMETIEALQSAGHQVYVHSVIYGGDMLVATLGNARDLAKGLKGRHLVLWVNEHMHKVEAAGKTLADMKAFKEMEDKLLGTVLVEKRNPQTYGADMQKMLLDHLTFEQALNDPAKFTASERQRLTIVRRSIFHQLDQVFVAA
jgi:hypothetical protein